MAENVIKTRIMKDTKNLKWWAEEYVGNRWIEIPNTRMSCEGNTSSSLYTYLKKRRDEYYSLFVEQVGDEKEYKLDF